MAKDDGFTLGLTYQHGDKYLLGVGNLGAAYKVNVDQACTRPQWVVGLSIRRVGRVVQAARQCAVFIAPLIHLVHIPGFAQRVGKFVPARAATVAVVPEVHQLFLERREQGWRQNVDRVGDFNNAYRHVNRRLGQRESGQKVFALNAQRRHFQHGLPGQ